MNVWWRRLVFLFTYFTCLLLLLNLFMSSGMFDILPESRRVRGFIPAPEGPYEKEPQKPRTRAILLLSSVGRSGSSFLGEALASQGNNMYFYEPIRALNHSQQTKATIQDELDRYFHCDVRESVLYIGKFPYINVKHTYTRGKSKGDISYREVVENCCREPLLIIKTIRTRLRWTRRLLDLSDVDLKVIHLVRDPRGTHTSMSGVDWKFRNKDMCNKVLEDLDERAEMERDYPGRYYFLKYEDLCRDPFHHFSKLFRFLRGQDPNERASSHSTLDENNKKLSDTGLSERAYPDLPREVYSYLRSHTQVNRLTRKTPWSTVRDTSTIYQKWRLKITPEELEGVEMACGELVDRLGHVIFGTVSRVRNLEISLFKTPGTLQ